MKSIRTALIGGLAVLALSVTVASASAAPPEFSGTTAYKATGGNVVFASSGVGEWKCSTSGLAGKITGAKTLTGTLTITGCYIEGFGKCATSPSSETITSNQLTGTLGYLSKSSKTVGLLLKPTSGETIAEYTCERTSGAKTKMLLTGGVVASITPVNTLTQSYALRYTQQEGKQNLVRLEGEAGETYLSSKFGTSSSLVTGIGAEHSVTTEKKIEIDA